MNNKECYISGKITGLDYDDAYALFAMAEKEVLMIGFMPVNPMVICKPNPEWTWQMYMVEDIKYLLNCSAIYMLKNWGDSKGARIERSIAQELGLEIIYQK